jgi:hypothetical protein
MRCRAPRHPTSAPQHWIVWVAVLALVLLFVRFKFGMLLGLVPLGRDNLIECLVLIPILAFAYYRSRRRGIISGTVRIGNAI